MGKVKVLDMSVANKIAAGEVVERPMSVIKELLENSIDAGSTSISIEIADGGLSYMRVADNGIGMDESDAKTAFLRHATSKIVSTDDLFSIATLGFRGEALASIAAVAKVRLRTHTKDAEFGTEVSAIGGDILHAIPCGCPNGTTIEVSDLFFNVPARQKFMKSARAEASQISDYVSRMILARPDIAIKLICSDRVLYQSSGDGQLKNAIYSVYGAEVVPHLREVNYSDGYLTIKGFVCAETLTRPTHNQQSLFVNGRYIRSPKIAAAVLDAYDTRVMVGKFPFFVLSLSIDYSDVDVNVHPNKLEVKFSDELRVVLAVKSAIRNALGGYFVPTMDVEAVKPAPTPIEKPVEATHIVHIQDEPATNCSSEPTVTSVTELPKMHVVDITDTVPVVRAPEVKKVDVAPSQMDFGIDPFEIVASVFDSFWIVRQGETMFIVDQHAAHERKLYERAMHSEQKSNAQMLLVPFIITLSPTEYDTFTENSEVFAELGFELYEFGAYTLKLTAVPDVFDSANAEVFFREGLRILSRQKQLTLKELLRDEIISEACKGAIKMGDAIPREMISDLLCEFNKNGVPMTCPHGRPVMVAITKKELYKMFKRIV